MPLRRVPTELAGEAGNSIIARLRLFAHEESAYIATGIKELLGAKGIASRSKGRYSSGLPMHVFVCVCVTLCFQEFQSLHFSSRGSRPPAMNLVQRS